ncbi:helix-turn-helix transcriptional regulator [Kutzneria albida]|nr:AraC family transcriptional regulator [Kutzneria albida]
MASERAEWAHVHSEPGRAMSLLTARFVRHSFAPHAHEEYAVGVMSGGLEVMRYRGGNCYAGPGSLVVLEPEETHTSGPAVPEGFAYRAFYPVLPERPHFREPVLHDPELAAGLRRLHHALSAGKDDLESQSRLVWLFGELARRHAVSTKDEPVAAGVAPRVKALLGDRLVDPPTLHELAQGLGLSRYQVVRAFREAVGIPPYAWLAQHRVARARRLLDEGHRPAQVAALVGFADQAHLTRWFRRVTGVTPGQYRNSVQDWVIRSR